MNEFMQKPNEKRAEIFSNATFLTALPAAAVEKDWWVTAGVA